MLRTFLYVLALASLGYGDELAAPAVYEGKIVAHIRFEPPSQPLSAAELSRRTGISEGKPLHLADVRAALKRLYESGVYSGIEATTESAAGEVTLVFRTVPQWFTGPVEAHGKIDAPPSSSQLANASRLELGAPFEETDVDRAVENLRALLERNGLYRATVTPKVTRDAQHQQVSITFEVTSGKHARLTLPNVEGDTRIPKEEVAHDAKYKEILFFPWKPATEANVQSGVESIRSRYEKKDRLTASVTLEKSDYLSSENRVRPTIQADGGPKVTIHTEGAKVSKGDLKKYVPVFDEGTVNRDLLVSGARNLRDYFQDRGYFDVTVDFSSHRSTPDQETITYTVARGEAHRVVRVDIKGNRYFKQAEIRDRMFIQKRGFIRLRHGRYSQSFAARDEEAVEALYRDNGFRDVKVSIAAADNYRGKKGDVALIVNIREGAQYLVAHLTVNGLSLPNRDALEATLASQPGQPFSDASVAMDRDLLLTACESAGYPNATFDYRAAQTAPGRINVEFTIAQGPAVHVREVLMSGLHTSRARLIDPLISLHAGDPLSWTEMGNMQRHLYDLGVFDKVDMAIQNPNGDEGQKYVDFHCVEGHLYSAAFGLGAEIMKIGGSATSISNPTGTTGFAPRAELQLSRINMWGLGHSVTFDGRYSTLDRRASLTYSAPRFHNVEGRNITVTGLYDNTRDVLTFTAVRLQGALQVSQRLSKATHLLFRYSWTDDRVDQSTLKINALLIPLYSQPAQVGEFSVNLVQDRRDDPADAHRGIYNSIDLGVADHSFGGSRNFLRMLGRNSYYKRLPDSMVLASNTEFGIIRPFQTGGIPSDEYVPLPERFYSGGESSMRGFPTDQAGPRDLETGFPLGGNALLFHSTELRFPLIGDNIGGVLFHDMGNVYSGLSSVSFRVHQSGLTDFDYMVHAVGFGIRYRTPLGPLRVDLAYTLNPPTFDGLKGTYQQLLTNQATRTVQNSGHFQFFFSVGQAF